MSGGNPDCHKQTINSNDMGKFKFFEINLNVSVYVYRTGILCMGDDISMYQREFPLKTVHHILSRHHDMTVGYEHVWSSSNIH